MSATPPAPPPAPASAAFELDALSPLDGRYASRVAALRPLLSESAFVRHRVTVEVEWLVALSDLGLPELPVFFQQVVRNEARPVDYQRWILQAEMRRNAEAVRHRKQGAMV